MNKVRYESDGPLFGNTHFFICFTSGLFIFRNRKVDSFFEIAIFHNQILKKYCVIEICNDRKFFCFPQSSETIKQRSKLTKHERTIGKFELRLHIHVDQVWMLPVLLLTQFELSLPCLPLLFFHNPYSQGF